MTDEEKIKLSAIHTRELDASFETFEYNGSTYHNVGLMQAWVRGYTEPNQHMTTEPPAWTKEFLSWLNEHHCSIRESWIGPPAICFPNKQILEEFKIEWHNKARERYPYNQTFEYNKRNRYELDEINRIVNKAEK